MNEAHLSQNSKGLGADAKSKGIRLTDGTQRPVSRNRGATLPPDLRSWVDCVVSILVKEYMAECASQKMLAG
jgi:hypothetical protein